MSAERQSRAWEVLSAHWPLAAADRLAAALADCGDDEDLRAAVRELHERLAAGENRLDDSELERAVGVEAARTTGAVGGDAALPESVAGYRILRRIARGGQGAVYEAEQDSPRRRVALKVVRPGMASAEALKRLELEADVLGRLQHPGIAQVHQAGFYEEGGERQPFFAMEFVEGLPLDRHCNEQGLGLRERLALVAAVSDAVHHAHLRGFIHRDLKPANVLVDAEGRPKVLDFGVARATDPDVRAATMATSAGQIVGTLPYMSPEQLRARPEELDVRTDVYSLGVLAYELLSGRLPHEVSRETVPEAMRRLAETPAPLLGRVDPTLRGELETLVGRALEHDLDRRYPSAEAFAADIRRYLAHEPIRARPPSGFYLARKFVRRHRLLTASVLAIVATVSVSGWLLKREATAARRSAELAQLKQAQASLQLGDIRALQGVLDESEADTTAWPWRLLAARADNRAGSAPCETHYGLALSPDGTQLACGSVGSRSLTRNADNAPARLPGLLTAAVFREDGSSIGAGVSGLSATGYPDSTEARAWELVSGRQLSSFGGRSLMPDAFSADGRRLLMHEPFPGPPELLLWEARTDRIRPLGVRAEVPTLSPDGRIVAGFGGERIEPDDPAFPLWLLDVESGERRLLRGSAGAVVDIDFDPEGRFVATAHLDYRVRVWEVESAELVATFETDRQPHSCVLGPGGRRLHVATPGAVQVWDVEEGRRLGLLTGAPGALHALAADPAGRWVAGAGEGFVHWWRAGPATWSRVHGRHDSYVYPVVVSPDGQRVVTAGWDGFIRIWDADDASLLHEFEFVSADLPGRREIRDAAISPDGKWLAAGHMGGRLRIWDLASGRLRDEWPMLISLAAVEFLADSRRVALCNRGPELQILDTVTGEIETLETDGVGTRACSLARAPRGRLVALSEGNGHVTVAPDLRGKRRLLVEEDQGAIGLAWSPDGSLLACGFRAGEIQVVDVATGRVEQRLRGHEGATHGLAFSPDGRFLATGGADSTLRVWDLTDGEEVLALREHEAYIWRLAWSPDGETIFTGSGDGTVRRWRAKPLD